MKTALRVLVTLIFFGASVALTCIDKGLSPQSTCTKETRPRPVTIALVEMSEPVKTVTFSGITRAVKRAGLSFTVAEKVDSRPVEVGDRVEKGDLLAKLDDRRFINAVDRAKAALREIEARIDQIERDRARYEKLVAADASADVRLEKILETERVLRASREAAEVSLREAERSLSETELKAPFSGTVTDVLAQPGEFVGPGVPVVVVFGDTEIEIEVEAPESIIHKLRVGDTASVTFPLVEARNVQGRISYLGRTSLGPGRLFPVLIRFAPKDRVSPGMTAEVQFQTEEDPQTCIPLGAVIDPDGEGPAVFKVSDNTAERVPVEIGQLVGAKVAVRGPLKPGDRVVAGGHLGLLDGDRIEVR